MHLIEEYETEKEAAATEPAQPEASRVRDCEYCPFAVRGGAPWTHKAEQWTERGTIRHHARVVGETRVRMCLTDYDMLAACGSQWTERVDSSD